MRPTSPKLLTLALSLSLSTMLAGCDPKIKQCNRLIDVINGEQDLIKDAASKNDVEGLKKLAETLDEVGKKVDGVELKDEKLQEFRGDYKKMVEDLAKVSRDSAEALETNDPNKAQDAQKKMSKFGARENELVNGINEYCQGG